MAEALTSPEEAAVSSFLDWLKREEQCQNTNLISHVTAVKFLMARKFDVARAIELFQAYTSTRIKEGIYNINPNEEPLRSELLSGKFTVLPGRDFRGAALALFTARLHRPELSTHTSVLQAIIYQLDKAIDSVQTQRAGLVFIYDMTNSCYRNFDYDLCVKILNLLKGAFPARLKCVFIVSSPLWFRAPFAVLRLFVREKLRERVCAVRASHLTSLIPASSLPEHLGGSSQFSHISWIQSCSETSGGEREQNVPTDARLAHGDLQCHHNGSCTGDRVASVNERHQSLPQSDTPTHGEEPNAVFVNSIQTVGSVECVDDRVGVPPLPLKSRVHPGAGQSVHVGSPGGMSVQELLQHVKHRRKKGIYQEYEEIRREPPAGTFHCSKKPSNQMKNRYSDVLCLDQSRVRLCPLRGDETSDYINASFMDGYKRTNAYIATQGPLPKTFGDFWRMVWEQMVLIIVMTTRVVERGRVKCGQYWPLEAGHSENYGYFLVKTVVVDVFQDFKLSHLQLVNTQTGECREVWHYLYISWPDFGVPRSAAAMLDFQDHVKRRREALSLTLSPDWPGPAGGPPVVVHCSAGIGRTGTFCTLDICLCGLEDVGRVDVRQTVRSMRTQRAFSIQTWDQYYFCYRALLEFCRRSGRITAGHWSDSELDSDSD